MEQFLPPIKIMTDEFEPLEKKIKELLREQLYHPILKELDRSEMKLQNSLEDLVKAINSGRISFYRGQFSGRFSSTISKELKGLGAKWDRKQGTWKIPLSSLPVDIQTSVRASEATFDKRLESIDKKLAQILPEEIADKLQAAKIFDATLWKVDKDVRRTLKGITVPPELNAQRTQKISEEYTNNLRRYIKDFTEKEIVDLRKDIQTTAFKGARYETLFNKIQKSYDVTAKKAKFLARQETNLLMTKFKEARYTDVGVNEYKWGCVSGTAKHPVRPMHRSLEGKVFRWDSPPITASNGARNNPGEDFNCRCFAKPIVKFSQLRK